MSFFETGGSAIKFPTAGTRVTGTIVGDYKEVQVTKFGTQEPDYWPDGSRKMQAVINLQTSDRDPDNPNDDGIRTLYVASSKMKKAIGAAIKDAGAADIRPGGTLTVEYTGDDPNSKNPANPAKLYRASYSTPIGSLGAPAVSPAPAVSAPADVPQPPTVDTEKVRSLIALGLDDAAINSALGIPTDTIAQIRAA